MPSDHAMLPDQDAVIAFLSRPESYALSAPVERIDTHCAMVFLAGDKAYKLKRAVRFPYLDFSTPEQRRSVCETELALNRRTAPDLYCEVRAIRRSHDGALSFTEGDPVDWVLVMRRFPQSALLQRIAARGECDGALARALADRIAAFHDGVPADRKSGGSGRMEQVARGNWESFAALREGSLARDEWLALKEATTAELHRVSELLDRRAQAGFVRHCHGDLHLANICLWNGEPTLFDCLEFDSGLATHDVLYDLAFLLMDLWTCGYRLQANQVFNRYCDMTGEAEAIALLPLFLSLRAAVRAHVCASAADQQADEAARLEKRAAAHRYLSAARAFLRRQPPMLVAIGGLSGTGKSSLAAELAPDLGDAPGARLLRSDVIRKRLAGVAPEERLPASAYAAGQGRPVYATLDTSARTVLEAGHAVIADAVFAREGERSAIMRIADQTAAQFTGIWLHAPAATLRGRVASRRNDASDATVDVVAAQATYQLGQIAPWAKVDAAGSMPETAARARHLLARDHPG